jgi:hypothetical protein
MHERELVLPQELIPFPEVVDVNGGRIAVLKSGIGGVIRGFKSTIRDKKRLVVVIALVSIWLLVNLLAALDIYPLPVRLLAWLTAAQGSLIGGTIGKGLVAALFAQIITDKEILQSIKKGISQLTTVAKADKKSYAPLMLGAGAALIASNMMVSSDLQNTMVAIAAFVLSAKALTNNGFLQRLTMTYAPKAQNNITGTLMSGWTLGFALFAVISLLPGGGNGYLLGAMLLIVAVIVKLTTGKGINNSQEVA